MAYPAQGNPLCVYENLSFVVDVAPTDTLLHCARFPLSPDQTLEVLPRPPQTLEASRPPKFTKLKERCRGHRKP